MTVFRDAFPHTVTEVDNLWITMPDGLRLAARVWMPQDAHRAPVPAILEYIPYRKRDGMALRDEMMHPYFAGHGYAAVRVDLRGSGDSEGVLDDEYTAGEQRDGLTVIDWISRQPWCSGQVGMIGISWGGFNGLQLAAHRPPALKAIVTVGSTDDRYADDVHYMGGAQLSANFTWAQTFFSDLTRPPDPLIVGPRWRQIWRERLDRQSFFIAHWLAHPERDAYWKHGSVCENYERIQCAVLVVGGWADSYTNAVIRLLSGLRTPRLGIVGPWGHDYPHTAVPGPQIGFLQECLRWWDHWLKGVSNTIMDEPLLRVFVQQDLSVDPSHNHREGRWIGLCDLPSQTSRPLRMQLAQARLLLHDESPADAGAPAQTILVDSPPTLGAQAGEWCAYGQNADQPGDQAEEDGLSVTFDTPPLGEPLDIIGTPRLRLRITPQGQAANVIVRLNEVDAAGRSARVSYGVLNLAFHAGFSNAQALVPGEPIDVEIKLCDTAYRFSAGKRIRVSVSSAYWPTVWPQAEQRAFMLHPDDCSLELPQINPLVIDPAPVRFEAPEASKPDSREVVRPGSFHRTLHRDLAGGEEHYEVMADDGETRITRHGLALGRRCVEVYTINSNDPGAAQITADWTMTLARDDWSIRTETRSLIKRDRDGFLVTCSVDAFEGTDPIYSHRFETRIPQD